MTGQEEEQRPRRLPGFGLSPWEGGGVNFFPNRKPGNLPDTTELVTGGPGIRTQASGFGNFALPSLLLCSASVKL